VFKTGAKVEDFANSGEPRFATLDIKLYAAVLSVIRDGNRTLATKVAGLEDAALTKGNVMKGRQLVFLVHDWFKLNPDMKHLYGLHEITDIKWYGDERIFDFLELWRRIVSSNSIELTPKQLSIILVEKMAPSKVLAQDVAYWKRLEDGNDQKTYEYLINAMQRHLDRDQWRRTTPVAEPPCSLVA
jgi:hypothetical protein